jgi:uncharacterized protein YfbU (UPF0304 family)
MEVLSLSPVERLTLANQFKILALSGEAGTDTDPADYNNKAEILLQGYTGLYHTIFEEVEDEEPASVTNEVHEIFSMFRTIDNSIAALSDGDREQLGDLKKLRFRGFDANNDDHYHQAKFMLERLDFYEEQQDAYLNSHDSSTLGDYMRQLAVFKEVREPMQNIDLAGLQAIANA